MLGNIALVSFFLFVIGLTKFLESLHRKTIREKNERNKAS